MNYVPYTGKKVDNSYVFQEEILRILKEKKIDIFSNEELTQLIENIKGSIQEKYEFVLNLIKTHYSEPEFNVNDILEKIGMSRSIFYKKFKALSEHSVNDLIKIYRIKKAADLLSTGNYSVSEAAYECGFSDPAYFSKVFKEHFKLSPKDYIGKR